MALDLAALLTPEALIAFATLTALEIVLGIDNIVFISIVADKLPVSQRKKARQVGLFLAMFIRVALLASISWIISLTAPLFIVPVVNVAISGRDLVLLLGGLFLLAKSVHEIHGSLEGRHESKTAKMARSFTAVIIQILLLDIVFSLDSVITAVGMTDQLPIMIAAVITAVAVMMFAAGPISDYVSKHPTIKMLALSFLILIGVMLVAESFDQHVPRGYLYFAMGFSLLVEMLNLRVRKVQEPVELHPVHEKAAQDQA